MSLLIAGLAVFLVSHSVGIVAPDWRARQVERLGERPWKLLYSAVSLAALREKVARWRNVAHDAFLHALVTEYRPGTPIGWHRDKPEYGMVIGISLASACRMRFRPYDNQHDRGAVIALELAPRSAYVLRDDVRWRWQHGIPPAKALRYSVTFRTRA